MIWGALKNYLIFVVVSVVANAVLSSANGNNPGVVWGDRCWCGKLYA